MTRFAAIFLGLFTVLGGLVAAGNPAGAQWSRDDRFFMLRDPFRRNEPFFFPFGGFRRERPAPRRQVVEEPPPDQPVGTVYSSSAEAERDRETPPTEFVIVLGDSIADQLAHGLADAFVADRPEVAVVKKTRGSSGFVRVDFYNWPGQVAGLLANEKASAIVIMLGSNDRQTIRAEGAGHEFRTERWREIYSQRVEETLNKLKEKGVPVFIVGPPPLRTGRLFEDMPYIADVQREAANKAGAIYVDVWDGFVDEAGEYMTTGPALDGQNRRLRQADGVHFTKAGARKLAHYVERDLIRLFDLGRGRIHQVPQDQPPEAAPPAGPAGRPVAGPVLPLTQPAGPVGQLAGGSRASGPTDPIAARVLVEGLPVPPVPGRADDFRWPSPTGAAALLGSLPQESGRQSEGGGEKPAATAPSTVPGVIGPGKGAAAPKAPQNPPAPKAKQAAGSRPPVAPPALIPVPNAAQPR